MENGLFDSSSLKIELKVMSIGDLLSMVDDGTIEIHENWNRQSATLRSRVVEGVLLGLPLQNIYMYARDNGNLAVIEGGQRLCALWQFASQKSFSVSKMEFLPMQNLGFNDLEFYEKMDFMSAKIAVNVIHGNLGEYGLSMLMRMYNQSNRSSVLPETDIREIAYQGSSIDIINRLCKLPVWGRFSHVRDIKDSLTIFLAFYLSGSESYENNKYLFIHYALKRLEKMDNSEVALLFDKIEYIANETYEIFGSGAFQYIGYYDIAAREYNFSTQLFSLLMMTVSGLTKKELDKLRTSDIAQRYKELIKGNDFRNSLRAGFKRNAINVRQSKLDELINNILK